MPVSNSKFYSNWMHLSFFPFFVYVFITNCLLCIVDWYFRSTMKNNSILLKNPTKISKAQNDQQITIFFSVSLVVLFSHYCSHCRNSILCIFYFSFLFFLVYQFAHWVASKLREMFSIRFCPHFFKLFFSVAYKFAHFFHAIERLLAVKTKFTYTQWSVAKIGLCTQAWVFVCVFVVIILFSTFGIPFSWDWFCIFMLHFILILSIKNGEWWFNYSF